jgi:nicotinate-nucleotide adenylyltransferase
MSSPASRPLGVLGGTFDPVHNAHLHLARAARARLGLDQVLWVPAGQPYHRQSLCTPAADRAAMVGAAIADTPAFLLDAGEVASTTPSYTVPTLERLRSQHGRERPLVLLLGADAFHGLPSWHRWEDLLALAHLGIAHRPGADLDPLRLPPVLAQLWADHHRNDAAALAAAPAGAIVDFLIEPVTPPDLSATLVRTRLQRGESVADLVPPGVLDYIQLNHLYLS